MEVLTKQPLKPTLSGPCRAPRFGHDQFADVIKKTIEKFPSNIAVRTSDGGAIRYSELWASASDLVRQLEAANIIPGDAVILKLPRSVDLVSAILATQVLGVAFVPVDPHETDERLRNILINTKASAIVDQDPAGSIRVACLQATSGKQPAYPDISYIMHTSGSTGVPKGIPVSQAAVLNMIDWYIDMFDFSDGTTISQLTRPTFDPSIPEFFVPFATGGTISLPSTELRGQIVQTIEFLIHSRTNVIQTVPTLLRRFLGTLERLPYLAEQFSSLRYVLCGGEALPDSLRRRFYAILPKATLINSYGPTECCVAVTYHYCPHDDVDLPMFIGKPVCNTDFFVLDEDLSDVGLEIQGELWVGGAQTPRNYVADEIETRQRLVPFMTTNGEQLLYRTGDYVVASEEQGLQYVGRRDDQIKYRGVRLEKGEITSAIDRTGLCADSAVVVVNKDEDKGQELVCVVTPASVDAAEVARRLADALPRDRAPRLVVPLAELPFTANGKLDQHALERTAKEAIQVDVKASAPLLGHSTGAPLDQLLRAIHAVTGRWMLPSSIARECDLDSLRFLEVQLRLAETGLMFCADLYQQQELSLHEWAKGIQLIGYFNSNSKVTGKGRKFRQFKDEFAQLLGYVETLAPSTIVLHSSLAELRDLTADEVASVLLEGIERISEFSTVILPAFTWSYCSTRRFHWTKTKSETGVLADLVMRELAAERTKHPVYSTVVTGPRTQELCETDWWKCSPFGDDSIFGFVSRLGGVVMGLGTPVATHVHRCELLARVPYMKSSNIDGIADFGAGPINISSPIYIRDVVGTPEYTFLARDVARDVHELKEVTHEFALGGTYARLIGVSDMEAILVRSMRREPYGFLREEHQKMAERAYPI
ncbi:AMP-binding protein [Sinorhizobium meliloti]|uniref:AMP-binding protein n=1 Tax=Rhizobium meliloti TaxID=382 RepID=UPI0030CAD12B